MRKKEFLSSPNIPHPHFGTVMQISDEFMNTMNGTE